MSDLASVEKKVVKSLVRRLLVDYRQPYRHRPDLLSATSGKCIVLITFSTSDQAFFDVSEKDLHEWESKAAYVVFIIGSHTNVLVVPADELRKRIQASRQTPSQEFGDFKLHLKQSGRRMWFKELPGWNLEHFHNNYFPLMSAT